MTPGQCREARGLLGWTRPEFADKSNVPLWFVAQFEDRGDPDESYIEWEIRLLRTLEGAGARFPFEIVGGRAGPAQVFLSRPEDGEAE
jgi:hypothetical protein